MSEESTTRASQPPQSPNGPTGGHGDGGASTGPTAARTDPLLPDAERIAEMRRRNARAAFEPDLRLLIQINMEDVPLLLYAVEQLGKRAEQAEAAVERVRTYTRWCAQHDVEPDTRTINAVLDGTDTYPYGDHVDQPKETPQ